MSGSRGPLSKPVEERQRRNKPEEGVELGSAPASTAAKGLITRRAFDRLHLETRRWWEDLLEAPQASQWIRTDWRRLRMVVLPLVEELNRTVEPRKGDPAFGEPLDTTRATQLAREIRAHEREFGLTPDARQRLNWRVPGPVKAAEPPRSTARPRATRSDPRLKLVDDG